METQIVMKPMSEWERLFQSEIEKTTVTVDPSHDILHLKRVVSAARKLAVQENANLNIVIPAAWLHDFVVIPKDSPLRKQASQISARRAVEFLVEMGYPSQYHEDIAHAIESHSFSAGIAPKTLEAKIVQDADRLDALGAVGIARCFITSGKMNTAIYAENDAFCENREPNDREFTIDHFYVKLFKIAETLNTKAALAEGRRRVSVMKRYLGDLKEEL